jgi:uncharacterized transporter YbjL
MLLTLLSNASMDLFCATIELSTVALERAVFSYLMGMSSLAAFLLVLWANPKVNLIGMIVNTITSTNPVTNVVPDPAFLSWSFVQAYLLVSANGHFSAGFSDMIHAFVENHYSIAVISLLISLLSTLVAVIVSFYVPKKNKIEW